MYESLLSSEINYQDDVPGFAEISFTGNPTKTKHETVTEKLNSFNLLHMNSVSQSTSESSNNKRSRSKQSTLLKTVLSTSSKSFSTNPLTKVHKSGIKRLVNRLNTRQPQNDSESLTITPTISSGCSSSLATSAGQGTTSKPIVLTVPSAVHNLAPPTTEPVQGET